MLKGLLAVNAFLHVSKFDEIYQILLDSAANYGVQLTITNNAEIILHHDDPAFLRELPDFVLYWDKDVKAARLMEQLGVPVFNPAESIMLCDDKALTYLALKRAGIPMPKTILVPKTFPNVGYPDTHFLDEAVQKLGLPIVLKECFGSFGKQVYLFNDLESLRQKVVSLRSTPMLLQEMVKSSYGRDIRINVVGGQVVASIYRHNDSGDFRSNITLGGNMDPYTPTEQEEAIALKAVEALGLAFAGVDVLFGETGPLICEVNSNAHFKSTMDCTGINMADAIFAYILKRIG
ncbi:MAG TPA: RimK family alpha-L-glutamate ligase [Candidatus Limiplasma sp.]|nr:RimK family alpha-L-glutamate ligase [Candidatus Limiplasma sp.]